MLGAAAADAEAAAAHTKANASTIAALAIFRGKEGTEERKGAAVNSAFSLGPSAVRRNRQRKAEGASKPRPLLTSSPYTQWKCSLSPSHHDIEEKNSARLGHPLSPSPSPSRPVPLRSSPPPPLRCTPQPVSCRAPPAMAGQAEKKRLANNARALRAVLMGNLIAMVRLSLCSPLPFCFRLPEETQRRAGAAVVYGRTTPCPLHR